MELLPDHNIILDYSKSEKSGAAIHPGAGGENDAEQVQLGHQMSKMQSVKVSLELDS